MYIELDRADSTTFLLSYVRSTRICKIVKKKIIIGNVVEIDFFPNYFYDKCAYSLNWSYYDDREVDVLNMFS
jgi:hypothetical protein